MFSGSGLVLDARFFLCLGVPTNVGFDLTPPECTDRSASGNVLTRQVLPRFRDSDGSKALLPSLMLDRRCLWFSSLFAREKE